MLRERGRELREGDAEGGGCELRDSSSRGKKRHDCQPTVGQICLTYRHGIANGNEEKGEDE